jgi:hypothetical protein
MKQLPRTPAESTARPKGAKNEVEAGCGTCGAARLPIVPHGSVKLSEDEQENLARLARRIAEQEPNLSTVPSFSPRLGIGLLPAPGLFVEDHGDIRFAHEEGDDIAYSYRSLVLAGDGDMLAVYGPRIPAFETYCRDVLRLGRVEAMSPAIGDPRRPPAIACAKDPGFVARVAQLAQDAGGLNSVTPEL